MPKKKSKSTLSDAFKLIIVYIDMDVDVSDPRVTKYLHLRTGLYCMLRGGGAFKLPVLSKALKGDYERIIEDDLEGDVETCNCEDSTEERFSGYFPCGGEE